MVSDQNMVYVIVQNLHYKILGFFFSFFSFKKVSDFDVVGVIPEELWSLTFLFNLYDFFFICLFTRVLHQYRLPSFSYKL